MARPKSLYLDISKHNYLTALAQCCDVAAARAAAGFSKDRLRDLRRRDADFKKEERRIATRHNITLDGRMKPTVPIIKKKVRRRAVPSPVPSAASPTLPSAPSPVSAVTASPVPPPPPVAASVAASVADVPADSTPAAGDTPAVAATPKTKGSALDSYIARLKACKEAAGTYKKSDEMQIEVCARQWQLVDRYEQERENPNYALRCHVHSTAVLEVNPFEMLYLNALKALQRSLQALGLNSDARGYDTKKPSGGLLEALYEDQRQIRAAHAQSGSVGGTA